MRGIIVQAGDIGELLTPSMLERFTDLAVDFFQGLDAVSRKGRRDHGDTLFALFGQIGHMIHRIGFQPFFPAKDRLEKSVSP